MSGFRAILNRQKERAKRSGGGGNNLWIKDGDIVRFHFMMDADNPNDPWITDYMAHSLPPIGDQKYGSLAYCPKSSHHTVEGYKCPYCDGDYPLKERLLQVLFVHEILRANKLRDDDQVEKVTYRDRDYFKYEIAGPMVWETTGVYRMSMCPSSQMEEIMYQLEGDMRAKEIELIVKGKQLDLSYILRVQHDSQPIPVEALEKVAKDQPNVYAILAKGIEGAEVVEEADEASEEPTPIHKPAKSKTASNSSGNRRFQFLNDPDSEEDPFEEE